MDNTQQHGFGPRGDEGRLLSTLERLLQLDATNVPQTLNAATQLVAETLSAEKVDAFLYHPENQTLQVAGLSATPMSKREVELGLDRLAIADGGRLVEVFQTGIPYMTGHAEQDPEVGRGLIEGLGVRSLLAVALEIGGERQGVLQVASALEEAFSDQDRAFLPAVATWVGLVLHRAGLVERLTDAAAESGRRMAADELITILAHDLRNLLSPISLQLQMLRRRFEQQQCASESQEIQRVLAGVARLHALIMNLLDTARLEHGLFAIEPQSTDLAALVRDTAAILSTSSSRIDVEAEHNIIVQADSERLRQVIENLLGNALHYSPPGVPISVSVEIEQQEADAGDIASNGGHAWAVLIVQDKGPGIPPGLLPRLFDRYEKDRTSLGMGLGLYVANQIIEAHGGTLTVDSTLGEGARFTVRLPLAEVRLQ